MTEIDKQRGKKTKDIQGRVLVKNQLIFVTMRNEGLNSQLALNVISL